MIPLGGGDGNEEYRGRVDENREGMGKTIFRAMKGYCSEDRIGFASQRAN